MKEKLLSLENQYYRLEIYDPSARSDLHFSTRYSHCGYIKQIVCKKNGRALLSSPKCDFDAFSGEGFPDEFEMPVGYDDALAGESFLKIGVGHQIKREEKAYINRDRHEICRLAEIGVCAKSSALLFTSSDSLGGYSYRYIKEISLNGDTVSVAHTLENTGGSCLNTLWYSHAFLSRKGNVEPVALKIPSFLRPVCGGAFLSKQRREQDAVCDEYGIVLCSETDQGVCCVWESEQGGENRQTVLAGGKIIYTAEGDYPLQSLQLFINARVISAEPKLRINLAPRQTYRWSTKYQLNCDD